jgi:hypothetical protein
LLVTETDDLGVVADETAAVVGKLELVLLSAVFGLSDDEGPLSDGTPNEAPPLIGVIFANLKLV